MQIEQACVLAHAGMAAGYRTIELASPGIAHAVQPGQFVHARIPRLEGATLRRPFSVCRADGDSIHILYKEVGRGTTFMTYLRPGDVIDLVGPLGHGFPAARAGTLPTLVAGGYGVAPLLFLASRLPSKGIAFVGAATADDLLCVQDFERLGWPVRVATDDGSTGVKGFVTNALDAWLADRSGGPAPEFFACGPDGMLKAVAARAAPLGASAWLSLDKHMGCGVGACLACVQKIRQADGAVQWLRVCREGPVFESRTIVWE